MTTCCSCCQTITGCKHQWIYFIVAVALWAYALAMLLIPADFPLQVGNFKDVFIEASLPVLAFNVFFVAVNIIIGAIANGRFNLALADKPGDYLLTKLRNGFVAAFGFTAFIRIIILLIWVVGYTA